MRGATRALLAAALAAVFAAPARPAAGATGDYLFSWGNEYHFSEPKDEYPA